MRKRHKTRWPGVWYRLTDETNPDSPRRYIVHYTDANKVEHTKTLPLGSTLEEAKLLRSSLQHRKAQGETLTQTKMTVGELLDSWLAQRRAGLKPATAENYTWAISHLKDEFGRVRVNELTPSHIASLITKLKAEGKKTWTVKKILTPLSGAYRVAVRDGLVTSSPVTKLLPHERPKGDQRSMRCLQRSEIDSLLRHAANLRWRALFTLLVFSGLRIGEALALEWEDIHEDHLVVRKSKTKAGEREVLLIPSLRRSLTKLKLQQPPGTTFVFATPQEGSRGRTGAPSRREALRALRVAEKKAGIPLYTLHELRHTFASILIAQGELPTLVAKQMGHADPAITMKTYAHLWQEKESVELASQRLQGAMGGLV
jgi:Site-specific recombinase XerD